ncbi:unnamed protein product, partial [Didymodactylos carnosus]
KIITITVERLSDGSRMTFTIQSDDTIKHLRNLLNYHLPPKKNDTFKLYSYQRGAIINFHPSHFTLDYFPVIFDQKILLLKMDDTIEQRHTTNKTKPLLSYLKRTKSTSSSISTTDTKKLNCLTNVFQLFRWHD